MDLYKIVLNNSVNGNDGVIVFIIAIILKVSLYIGAKVFSNNVRTTIKG